MVLLLQSLVLKALGKSLFQILLSRFLLILLCPYQLAIFGIYKIFLWVHRKGALIFKYGFFAINFMELQTIVVNDLELRLRPCSLTDQGFVYELMRHHLEDFFDRNTVEGWSRTKFRQGFDPERIVIVEHDGMPVGFFDYEIIGEEVYWHNVQLSGDYQIGIGGRIANLIESEAKNRGAREIFGKVFSDNERVIKWVRRLGFEISREIPEENSYVVRKELCGL
jgi:RimJ/RimL family protein N-acetyltransferase